MFLQDYICCARRSHKIRTMDLPEADPTKPCCRNLSLVLSQGGELVVLVSLENTVSDGDHNNSPNLDISWIRGVA